jgi:hypothetical protein
MAFNSAKNILVGASPLYISTSDSTVTGYKENLLDRASGGISFTARTKAETALDASTDVRNVGFTNNGLQITYNPTYDSVTVDQLLDTAKLFKSAMEVMIATEMSEGTLENVLVVFGQGGATLTKTGSAAASTDDYPTKGATGADDKTLTLGLEAGSLGIAPTERQLFAVGQAPTLALPTSGTEVDASTERVYYARRVLSVQQSQFSLARNAATTFPVTFRLLPDAKYSGSEYGKIIDRVLA